MTELEELKALFDGLNNDYKKLLNQKVANHDNAIQTIKKFAEFIESYGDEIHDLKQDLETADFNKNLRQVINPESGFFKVKLSQKLYHSLETNFQGMVNKAFGNAGVGGPFVQESNTAVKEIVATVNGAMNLPGIGQAIDSNPYGAIVKEAVSTTSSLVLLIATAVQEGKKKKLLKEFYSLLPDVKNSILSELNKYLEFYSKTQKFNDDYDATLKVINIASTTIYNRTVELCTTIRTALIDAGISAAPIDTTKSIKEITQILKSTLEDALSEDANKPKMEPILIKLETLIKTQSLDLYQQYFTLAEERRILESSFFDNFLSLFQSESYKDDTNLVMVNEMKTAGTTFIKGITDEISANKKIFKEKLKKIYF